jgi:hypothetical protein
MWNEECSLHKPHSDTRFVSDRLFHTVAISGGNVEPTML